MHPGELTLLRVIGQGPHAASVPTSTATTCACWRRDGNLLLSQTDRDEAGRAPALHDDHDTGQAMDRHLLLDRQRASTGTCFGHYERSVKNQRRLAKRAIPTPTAITQPASGGASRPRRIITSGAVITTRHWNRSRSAKSASGGPGDAARCETSLANGPLVRRQSLNLSGEATVARGRQARRFTAFRHGGETSPNR